MYYFEDARYIRAHGKKPRGRGWWAFEIKGRAEAVFASGNKSLTEAKREITQRLKDEGVEAGTIIYVAP